MTVIGGTYLELCAEPQRSVLMGSGMRGALALSTHVSGIHFVSAVGKDNEQNALITCDMFGVRADYSIYDETISFSYNHPLSRPFCSYNESSMAKHKMPDIAADCILMYGQIEGRSSVTGDYVTYDPQNWESFRSTGSKANHLALVLNRREAYLIAGCSNETDLTDVGRTLLEVEGAEVVVIKDGANGAWVFDKGDTTRVPAFRTRSVWPIGSGDIFSAVFAWKWSVEKQTPFEAATSASKYTAHYCQHQSLPLPPTPEEFEPLPLTSRTRNIYLAGPFFTMAERWLINELRDKLLEFGNTVFSPMHDVGFGTDSSIAELDLDGIEKSDVVLAVMSGSDPGTLFEIGYARAKGKRVVVFLENRKPNDLTMFSGSGCEIVDDFATAVYSASW